jgi:hypothetical protein
LKHIDKLEVLRTLTARSDAAVPPDRPFGPVEKLPASRRKKAYRGASPRIKFSSQTGICRDRIRSQLLGKIGPREGPRQPLAGDFREPTGRDRVKEIVVIWSASDERVSLHAHEDS